MTGKDDNLFHTKQITAELNSEVLQLPLLSKGFLQQGAPELVPITGVHKHQLAVVGRQTIVHNHLAPSTLAPDLKSGRKSNKTSAGSKKKTKTKNEKNMYQKTHIFRSLFNPCFLLLFFSFFVFATST